jgi:hypothetical protein
VDVPRIVQQDAFDLAQERLDQGRQLSHRDAFYDYFVGRRIKCECSYSMYSGVGGEPMNNRMGQVSSIDTFAIGVQDELVNSIWYAYVICQHSMSTR